MNSLAARFTQQLPYQGVALAWIVGVFFLSVSLLPSCKPAPKTEMHSASIAHSSGLAEWCGWGIFDHKIRFVVIARAKSKVAIPGKWTNPDGPAILQLSDREIDLFQSGGVYELEEGLLIHHSEKLPTAEQIGAMIKETNAPMTMDRLFRKSDAQ